MTDSVKQSKGFFLFFSFWPNYKLSRQASSAQELFQQALMTKSKKTDPNMLTRKTMLWKRK